MDVAQHKRTLVISCICLVAIGMVIPLQALPRQIRYSFTIENTTNRLAKGVHFWTYAPFGQTSIETSCPFQLITDDLGNQILHFTLFDIPPYATRIITVEAGITPAAAPDDHDTRPYLKAEPYCESDNPAIVQLAQELTASTTLETVENIFRWVSAHVRYTGYLKNPRGALYALENREGDCTEFMYLFVALCRASKIPARGIGGYLNNGEAVLRPEAYHNWAECLIDGSWRMVDPQRRVWMGDRALYIPIHVIGDAPKNPIIGPYRFRYEGEGIKVVMN